jgi:hypothetical protein
MHTTTHDFRTVMLTATASTQRVAWIAVATALLAWASPATAQDSLVFISVNGGSQLTSTDFADNVVFTEFVEEGDFDAAYRIDSGAIFDIGGGVRLPFNLGIGAGFSRFDKSNDASVNARIPHPFFFDRDRSIAGSAASLTRTETAVHLQVRWFAPIPGAVELSVFGGPTFFSVTQGLVTAVEFSQTYPFDVASFTGAASGTQTESAVGYNVGADVGFFFSRYVGIGALVRFSRASLDLVSEDSGVISVDAGGFHAGGGLRLRF